MTMNYPRYLHTKQTVDDRALNKDVLHALRANLAQHPAEVPLRVIEVGAGIGTMLSRLLRWGLFPPQVDYILLDAMPENIQHAQIEIPRWAAEHSWQPFPLSEEEVLLESHHQTIICHFLCADLFDYIEQQPLPAHLLIAHAVLDLLPMPESLQKMMRLLFPNGLAWLTLNFDGVTIFEPELSLMDLQLSETKNPLSMPVDAYLTNLYHQTMHTRPGGGDSQTGRHLFSHITQSNAEILAAGASDWLVYPQDGAYPAEEAYFLHCILDFFEESLSQHPEVAPNLLGKWLQKRRAQIDAAELVYIAHQMDFLVRRRA